MRHGKCIALKKVYWGAPKNLDINQKDFERVEESGEHTDRSQDCHQRFEEVDEERTWYCATIKLHLEFPNTSATNEGTHEKKRS